MLLVLGAGALAFFAQGRAQDVPVGQAQADVLVRPVARGAVLQVEDFERRTLPPMAARVALRAVDIAGQEARRALPAGTTVRSGDVGAPLLVRRGDLVTLEVRSGALRISAPGRALGDGASGAAVRAVNLSTSRTLDGRVSGSGMIAVTAP
ncbi:flagella basal body P-ring formation protein FlgA [Sphingobium subterraneum]|uniref:Flagella basal body P-ring formation protein FlgA n=2 Tax=Sphingobium subterraneum TaxID=627688 RepID=A0A841IVT9_9SPHN|nr:flagella basal body P-ring formation protein FlgA [Sphingobium subterraneum]